MAILPAPLLQMSFYAILSGNDYLGLFTTRDCKEACDQLHPKKKGGYGACLDVCRQFNGCSCAALGEYCDHLYRHRDRKKSIECYLITAVQIRTRLSLASA